VLLDHAVAAAAAALCSVLPALRQALSAVQATPHLTLKWTPPALHCMIQLAATGLAAPAKELKTAATQTTLCSSSKTMSGQFLLLASPASLQGKVAQACMVAASRKQ
jgi:hypothetical protein